jgi:RNA polymerase sigma-70 factor (ECF subfamily)
MLANRQDAEDILQDTYLKINDNIASFRGESSFKTWVFTIALNLARNLLKKNALWKVEDTDIARTLHEQDPQLAGQAVSVFLTSSPDKNFQITEHLDYCFTCVTKTLDLTQQICLLLKEVYGFKQDEIEKITGLGEGKVKHGIVDARRNMVRIFENRCALINKTGVCDQCSALKGRLNPDQDAHIEINKLKLAQEAATENGERLLDLRLELVRSVDPINHPSSQIHIHFLENIPKWVKMAQTETT